jgi:hypothetical protein
MLIYFIIILAVITRFIPHMPNAAPVTALAIFAAVYLPKKQAIGIPLVVRFVSDIFLGFFAWPQMLAVYAAHLVGVLFGLWVRKTTSLSLGGTRDISPQKGRELHLQSAVIPSPFEERVRERLQKWN